MLSQLSQAKLKELADKYFTSAFGEAVQRKEGETELTGTESSTGWTITVPESTIKIGNEPGDTLTLKNLTISGTGTTDANGNLDTTGLKLTKISGTFTTPEDFGQSSALKLDPSLVNLSGGEATLSYTKENGASLISIDISKIKFLDTDVKQFSVSIEKGADNKGLKLKQATIDINNAKFIQEAAGETIKNDKLKGTLDYADSQPQFTFKGSADFVLSNDNEADTISVEIDELRLDGTKVNNFDVKIAAGTTNKAIPLGPIQVKPNTLDLQYKKGDNETAGSLYGSVESDVTIKDVTIAASIKLNKNLKFGSIPSYYQNFSTDLEFENGIDLGGIKIAKGTTLAFQFLESPTDNGKVDKIYGLKGNASLTGLGPVDKLVLDFGKSEENTNAATTEEVKQWLQTLNQKSTTHDNWSLGNISGGLKGKNNGLQLGPLSMSGLEASVSNLDTLPWGLVYYKPATTTQDTITSTNAAKLSVTAKNVNLDIGVFASLFKKSGDGLTVFADKIEPAIKFLTQEVGIADSAPEILKKPLVEFIESTPGNEYKDGKVQLIEIFDVANATYTAYKESSFKDIKTITKGVKSADNFIKKVRKLAGYAQNTGATGLLNLGDISYSFQFGDSQKANGTVDEGVMDNVKDSEQKSLKTNTAIKKLTSKLENEELPPSDSSSNGDKPKDESHYTNNTSIEYPAFKDLSGAAIKLLTRPDDPIKLLTANLDFGLDLPLGFSTRIPAFPLLEVGFDGNLTANIKTAGEIGFSGNDLYGLFKHETEEDIVDVLLGSATINLDKTALELDTSVGLSVGLDAFVGAISATAGVKGNLILQPEIVDGAGKRSEKQAVSFKDLFKSSNQSNARTPARINKGLGAYKAEIGLDFAALIYNAKQTETKRVWFKIKLVDNVIYDRVSKKLLTQRPEASDNDENYLEITDTGWLQSKDSLSTMKVNNLTSVEIDWNVNDYRNQLKANIEQIVGENVKDSIVDNFLALANAESIEVSQGTKNEEPKQAVEVKSASNTNIKLNTLNGATGNFENKEYYLLDNGAVNIKSSQDIRSNAQSSILITFEIGSNFKEAYKNANLSIVYPANTEKTIELGSLSSLVSGKEDYTNGLHWIANLNQEAQGKNYDKTPVEFYSQSVAVIGSMLSPNKAATKNVLRDLLTGNAILQLQSPTLSNGQSLGFSNPWIQENMALGYSNFADGNLLKINSRADEDPQAQSQKAMAAWIRPYNVNNHNENDATQEEGDELSLFESSFGVEVITPNITISLDNTDNSTKELDLKAAIVKSLEAQNIASANASSVKIYDTRSTTDPVTGNQFLSIAYQYNDTTKDRYGNMIVKLPTLATKSYQLVDNTLFKDEWGKVSARDILAAGNSLISLGHNYDYKKYNYDLTEYTYTADGPNKNSKTFTATEVSSDLFTVTTNITSVLAGNKPVAEEHRDNKDLSIGYYKINDNDNNAKFAIGIADAGQGIVFTSAKSKGLAKNVPGYGGLPGNYLTLVDMSPLKVSGNESTESLSFDLINNLNPFLEPVNDLGEKIKVQGNSLLDNLNLFDSTYAILNQAMIRTGSEVDGIDEYGNKQAALGWWNGMQILDVDSNNAVNAPSKTTDYLQGITFPEYTSQQSLVDGLDQSIYTYYRGSNNSAIVNAGGVYFSEIETGWQRYLEDTFKDGTIDLDRIANEKNPSIKSWQQIPDEWSGNGRKVGVKLSINTVKPTKLFNNDDNNFDSSFEVIQTTNYKAKYSYQTAPATTSLGALQAAIGGEEVNNFLEEAKGYSQVSDYGSAWKDASHDMGPREASDGISFTTWMQREPIEIAFKKNQVGNTPANLTLLSTLNGENLPNKDQIDKATNQLTELTVNSMDGQIAAENILIPHYKGLDSWDKTTNFTTSEGGDSLFIKPGSSASEGGEVNVDQNSQGSDVSYFPATTNQLSRLVRGEDGELLQRSPNNDTFWLDTKLPKTDSELIKAISGSDPRYAIRDQWVLAVSVQDAEGVNYYGFIDPSNSDAQIENILHKQESNTPSQYLSLVNKEGNIIGGSGKFESLYSIEPKIFTDPSQWEEDLTKYLNEIKTSEPNSFILPANSDVKLNVWQTGAYPIGGSDLLTPQGQGSTLTLGEQVLNDGQQLPTGWQTSTLDLTGTVEDLQFFTDADNKGHLYAWYLKRFSETESDGWDRYLHESKDGGLTWSNAKKLSHTEIGKPGKRYSPTVIGDSVYAIDYSTNKQFKLLEFSLSEQTYKGAHTVKFGENQPHLSYSTPVIVKEGEYLSVYFVNSTDKRIGRVSYKDQNFETPQNASWFVGQTSNGNLEVARFNNKTYIAYPGTTDQTYWITTVDNNPGVETQLSGHAKKLASGLLANWVYKEAESKPQLDATSNELIFSLMESDKRRFIGLTPDNQENTGYQVRQLIDLQATSDVTNTLTAEEHTIPLTSGVIYSSRKTTNTNATSEFKQQIVPIPSSTFKPVETIDSNQIAWLLPRGSDNVPRLTSISLIDSNRFKLEDLYNKYFTDETAREKVLRDIVDKFKSNNVKLEEIKTQDAFTEKVQELISQIDYDKELKINKPSPYIELAGGRIFDLGISNSSSKTENIQDSTSSKSLDTKKLNLNLKSSIDAFLRADARLLWSSINLVDLTFPLWNDQRSIATGITLGGPVIASNSIWIDINSDLKLGSLSEEVFDPETKWGSNWSISDQADKGELQNAITNGQKWSELLIYSNPRAIDAMTGLELEVAFVSNLENSAQANLVNDDGGILNIISGLYSIDPLFEPLEGNEHPKSSGDIEALFKQTLNKPEQAPYLSAASANDSLYSRINDQNPEAYNSLSTLYLLQLLTIWINRALQVHEEQLEILQLFFKETNEEGTDEQSQGREQATKRSILAYNLLLGYLEFIAIKDYSSIPESLRLNINKSFGLDHEETYVPEKISYDKSFFEQTFKFLNTFFQSLIDERLEEAGSGQGIKLLDESQIERLTTGFFQVANSFYAKMDALKQELSNGLNANIQTTLSALGGLKSLLLDPTMEPSVTELIFPQGTTVLATSVSSEQLDQASLQTIIGFDGGNAVLGLNSAATQQLISLQAAGQVADGQKLILRSSNPQPLTGLPVPLILTSSMQYGEQGHYYIEGFSERAPLFLELANASEQLIINLKPGILASKLEPGSKITLGLGQPLGQAVISPTSSSTTLYWDGSSWLSDVDKGQDELIQVLQDGNNHQQLISGNLSNDLDLVKITNQNSDPFKISHQLFLPAGRVSNAPAGLMTNPVWRFLVLNGTETNFSVYTSDENQANEWIESDDHVLAETADFYVSNTEAEGLVTIYQHTNPSDLNDQIFVQEDALDKVPARYTEKQIAWYALPGEVQSNIIPAEQGITREINRDRLNISTRDGSSASWVDLSNIPQNTLVINVSELNGVLDLYGFNDNHQLILINQDSNLNEQDVDWSGQSIQIGTQKGIRFWGKSSNYSTDKPDLSTAPPVTFLNLDATSWIDLNAQHDVHRFWNQETASFHYVSEAATISSLIRKDSINNWRYEGLAFQSISPLQVASANTVTIQRFDHPDGATRFAANEGTIKLLLEEGYEVSKSVAKMISPSLDDAIGLIKVYQFISRETNQALLTASSSEIRALQESPDFWLDLGVIGMVAEPSLPFQPESTALTKTAMSTIGLYEVEINNGDGSNSSVQLKLDGGQLRNNGITIISPTPNINAEIQNDLERQGIVLNQNGLDFTVDVAASSTKVSLSGSVAALGGISDQNMAYYSIHPSGEISPLTYDPILNAGMRVFDLDGDKTADWFNLKLVDGGYGDKDKVANGEIVDPSIAGQVALDPIISYNSNGSLTIGDPSNDAPAAVLLTTHQGEKSSSVQQIGYVILNPDEVDQTEQLFSNIETLKTRASILFSSLEEKDVILPVSFRGEQDIQLINGQNIVFFSLQQVHLNELKSSSDPRLSWLKPLEQNSQLSSYRTPDGFEFSIGLKQTPASLNALIASEQSQSPILDFSALRESQTIYGTLQIGREANFDHLTGFYSVLDHNGTVMSLDGARLKPGDPGYTDAALHTNNLASELNNLQVADNQTIEKTFQITGGRILAPYSKVAGQTFFAFADANADKISHFRSLGQNQIGLEDLYGGGDFDFDDGIYSFEFELL